MLALIQFTEVKKMNSSRRFSLFCFGSLLVAVLFSAFMLQLPPSMPQAVETEGDFIKWVDFTVSYEALSDCLSYDLKTYQTPQHIGWIDLLATLAAKCGGNFSAYKPQDLTKLTDAVNEGAPLDRITKTLPYFSYYKEAYTAVLGGFVGEHTVETEDAVLRSSYGLKVFSPIAKGFSFSHGDDFGNKRSYGYARKHLGHDLMGSVGTPVIAIESGYVEALGWNQYGGWRIGIRSFDKKRYYYYAHLRRDHPYNDLYEGKIVTAGDVIGFLGMTGYSTKENVNNIQTPHLHLGLQLIFDESQKETDAEIWIDLYALTKLLEQNKSAVYRPENSGEYERKFQMFEPAVDAFCSVKIDMLQ